MPSNYKDAIEEILATFNFEIVHTHMALTGWTYFDSPLTPTIERLKDTARELLEKAAEKNTTSIKGGGFEATMFRSKVEPSELTLAFIATETTAYV